MKTIVVVDKLSDIDINVQDANLTLEVMTAKEFLTGPIFKSSQSIRVINCCRSLKYLSTGYYCSLLAESRKYKVIPTAKSVMDMAQQRYLSQLSDLDETLEKCLKRFDTLPSDQFSLLISFGQCANPFFKEFAQEVFDTFRYPALKVDIRKNLHFHVHKISPVRIHRLLKHEKSFLTQSFFQYVKKPWRSLAEDLLPKFSLAILINENDPNPPSNQRALKKFESIGEKMNIEVEFITKKDYHRLTEFDALFIRETTLLTDHTYRFALKAEYEGMPVLDESSSILRCTNKIYIHELLSKHKIPTIPTTLVSESNLGKICESLEFPVVVKIPDSNFSKGVHKAKTIDELKALCVTLFHHSELLLIQPFVPTEFDWRVGILAGKAVFVCRYFMAKNHWQIYKVGPRGKVDSGDTDCFPVDQCDPILISLAENAAKCIGNGLFGIDIKQTTEGYLVVEINDNPNIDHGIEDLVLKDELYRMILADFQRRIEKKWGQTSPVF